MPPTAHACLPESPPSPSEDPSPVVSASSELVRLPQLRLALPLSAREEAPLGDPLPLRPLLDDDALLDADGP